MEYYSAKLTIILVVGCWEGFMQRACLAQRDQELTLWRAPKAYDRGQ